MAGDNVVFIVQLQNSRLDCHLMVIAVVVVVVVDGGGRSDYNSINRRRCAISVSVRFYFASIFLVKFDLELHANTSH